jgi:hypothetical protein
MGDAIIDRIKSGKIPALSAFTVNNAKNKLNEAPEADRNEIYRKMSEKFKGPKTSTEIAALKQGDEQDFWRVKAHLADVPSLSDTERSAHANDVASEFTKHVMPNVLDIKKAEASPAGKAFQQLCLSGNKEALETVVNTPSLLAQYRAVKDIDHPVVLRTALNKLQSLYDQDYSFMDRNGQPTSARSDRAVTHQINNVLMNKNLSHVDFENYLGNPNTYTVFGNDDGAIVGSSGTVSTVLENRFNNEENTSVEQRNSLLTKMGAMDSPIAKEAVLLTAHTPKDLYRSTWVGLDGNAKLEIYKQLKNEYSEIETLKNADPQTLSEIVGDQFAAQLGIAYGDEDSDKASAHAAKHLINLDKPEHREILRNLVRSPRLRDNQEMQNVIATKVMNDPDPQFIQTLIDDTGHMEFAHRLARIKASRELSNTNSPEASDRALQNFHNTVMQKQWPDYPELTPELKKNAAWRHLLDGKESNDTFLRQLMCRSDANIAKRTDFLANMGPGTEDIRDLALKKGLISTDTIKQLADSGQLSLSDHLAALPELDRTRVLAAYLTKPETLTTENLSTVVAQANHHVLAQMSGQPSADRTFRTAAKDSPIVEQVRKATETAVARILALDPARVQQFLENTLTKGETGRYVRRECIEAAASAIQKSTLDPSAKNQILLDIHEHFSRRGDTRASLFAGIAKNALASKDIATIIKMSSMPDAPAAITKALGKVLANPKQLDIKQSLQLFAATNLSHVDAMMTAKIVDNYEDKIAAEPLDQQASHKVGLVDGLTSSFKHADEGSDKQDILLKSLKGMSLDPEVHGMANARLRTLISHGTIHSADLFKFLPAEDTSFVGTFPGTSYKLPPEVLNDSKVIEDAGTGWKLNVITNQARDLSRTSLSIVASRIAESTDGALKRTGIREISNKAGGDPDDLKKVLRSTDLADIHNVCLDMARQEDLSGTMAHEIVNHLMAQESIAPGIRDSASLLAKIGECDDDANVDEKQKTMLDFIDKAHAFINPHLDDGSQRESIQHVFRNVIKCGLEHTKESALKMFDFAKGSNSPELMNGWAKGCSDKLNLDEWKKCAARHPELDCFMSSRSSIDSAFGEHLVKQLPDMTYALGDLGPQLLPLSFAKMDSECLDKHGVPLLSAIVKLGKDQKIQGYIEAVKQALAVIPASKIDENLMLNIVKASPEDSKELTEMMMQRGVGGDKLIDTHLDNIEKKLDHPTETYSHSDLADDLEPLSKSIALSDKHAKRLMAMATKHKMENIVVERFASNKLAPPALIDALAQSVLGSIRAGSSEGISSSRYLLANPQISEDSFMKLHEVLKDRFPKTFDFNSPMNPAFLNARFGVKILQQAKPVLPESFKNTGIDEESLPRTAHGELPQNLLKTRGQLEEAMRNIPAEGIAWPEFKKLMPAADNLQSVKQIFTKKNNKPVMPEDMIAAIREIDQSKARSAFTMTYGLYNYQLQQHNDNPSLVFQVNNSTDTQETLGKNPKTWALYQSLIKLTNQYYGSAHDVQGGEARQNVSLHPISPQGIGWSRVDTASGKDGWIIEEFQADAVQKLRKKARSLISTFPSGLSLEGQSVTAEDILGKEVKVRKNIRDTEAETKRALGIKHEADKMRAAGATKEALIEYFKTTPKTPIFKMDAEGQPLFEETSHRQGGSVSEIEATIKGWQRAAFDAIVETAHKNGVKKLYMHGAGVRACMSGRDGGGSYNGDYINENIKAAYDVWPKASGFKECDYTDYPNTNKNIIGNCTKKRLSTKCWVLDVAEHMKKKS